MLLPNETWYVEATWICTGIGKSMFGYWLPHKWALEGRRIVFRKKYFEGHHHILFCNDGIFEVCGDDLLAQILADPETRYGIICSSHGLQLSLPAE